MIALPEKLPHGDGEIDAPKDRPAETGDADVMLAMEDTDTPTSMGEDSNAVPTSEKPRTTREETTQNFMRTLQRDDMFRDDED